VETTEQPSYKLIYKGGRNMASLNFELSTDFTDNSDFLCWVSNYLGAEYGLFGWFEKLPRKPKPKIKAAKYHHRLHILTSNIKNL
jgi:hypothetical protein